MILSSLIIFLPILSIYLSIYDYSFLQISSIPLHGYTIFVYYLSTDGHLGCFQYLARLRQTLTFMSLLVFISLGVGIYYGMAETYS